MFDSAGHREETHLRRRGHSAVGAQVARTWLGQPAWGPGIVCFRPKPGLAQKKIHSRSISAAQLAPISCRSRKSSECSWTQNPPPPALLVPINVQCISPSEQRLVLECFYPTRPDKGPSTHAQPVTSSLLPTASPEDCMLRKTQHKPDNVLR